MSLYIATFTKSISSQLTATVVLSLFNSSAVVGQIFLGHLSDRFPYPFIMVVSALGSALAAFFLWGFANAAIFLYFFAVIFGGLVSALCSDNSLIYSLSWSRVAASRPPGRTALWNPQEASPSMLEWPSLGPPFSRGSQLSSGL